jgi:hypothetical protein
LHRRKLGFPDRQARAIVPPGQTPRPVQGENDMRLIRTASIALALGIAVAVSAPAGATTMHHHKVVKVVKAPHYKNPILGFFMAIFHAADHDKDMK